MKHILENLKMITLVGTLIVAASSASLAAGAGETGGGGNSGGGGKGVVCRDKGGRGRIGRVVRFVGSPQHLPIESSFFERTG